MREKKKKGYVSEIVQVSPWRAFTGFAVDFFLSLSLILLGRFFLTPHLQEAMGAKEVYNSAKSMLEESSLCYVSPNSSSLEWNYYVYGAEQAKQLDASGKIKDVYGGKDEAYVGHYPFELYVDIIYDYYSSFCLKEGNAFIDLGGNIRTDIPSMSENDRGKYIGESIFGIKEDTSSFFAFEKDGLGNPKYAAKPVLNLQNPVVIALQDESTALFSSVKINDYFVHFGPKYDGVYELTFSYFEVLQPKMVEARALTNYITYISKLPVHLVPPFIFLILLPLILRDGKGIGRLLSNTALIDERGYSAPKWMILLSQLILFAPFLLGLLPFDVLALASGVLLYLVEFLLINTTPSKRGLHEILTKTMTVNDGESSYFASRREWEEYKASHGEDIVEEETVEVEAVEEKPVEEAPVANEPPEEPKIGEKPEEPIIEAEVEGVSFEDAEEDEDAFLDDRKKK